MLREQMTDLKDVTLCKSGHGEFGVEAGPRDPLACWRAGSGGLETGVHLSRHHSRTRLSISSEPWNPVFSVVLPASIRGAPESQTRETDSLPTSAEASWRMPVSLLQSRSPSHSASPALMEPQAKVLRSLFLR